MFNIHIALHSISMKKIVKYSGWLIALVLFASSLFSFSLNNKENRNNFGNQKVKNETFYTKSILSENLIFDIENDDTESSSTKKKFAFLFTTCYQIVDYTLKNYSDNLSSIFLFSPNFSQLSPSYFISLRVLRL